MWLVQSGFTSFSAMWENLQFTYYYVELNCRSNKLGSYFICCQPSLFIGGLLSANYMYLPSLAYIHFNLNFLVSNFYDCQGNKIWDI